MAEDYLHNFGKVSLTAEGEHSSSKPYERLCLVYKTNTDGTVESFVSRKAVPTGINLSNREYWQPIAISLSGSSSGNNNGNNTQPSGDVDPVVNDIYYDINVVSNIPTAVVSINGVQKSGGNYKKGTVLNIVVRDSSEQYMEKAISNYVVTKHDTINVTFTAEDKINTEEYYYIKINSINVEDGDIIIKVGNQIATVGNSYRVLKGLTVTVTATDNSGKYEQFSRDYSDSASVDIQMIPVSQINVITQKVAENMFVNNAQRCVDYNVIFRISGYSYTSGFEGKTLDELRNYCPIELVSVDNNAAMILHTKESINNWTRALELKNDLTGDNTSLAYAIRNYADDDIFVVIYGVNSSTEDVVVNCIGKVKENNKTFNISFTAKGYAALVDTVSIYLRTIRSTQGEISQEDLNKINVTLVSVNNEVKNINLKTSRLEVVRGSTIRIVVTTGDTQYQGQTIDKAIILNSDGMIDLVLNVVEAEKEYIQVNLVDLYDATNILHTLTKGTDYTSVKIIKETIGVSTTIVDKELISGQQYSIEKGTTIKVKVICPNASNFQSVETDITLDSVGKGSIYFGLNKVQIPVSISGEDIDDGYNSGGSGENTGGNDEPDSGGGNEDPNNNSGSEIDNTEDNTSDN